MSFFSSIFSIFGAAVPVAATAVAKPASPAITIPVHVSNAVIPTTVNNGLGILAVITTYLASSGIDLASISNTFANGNFWAGLVATGVTLAVKHTIVTNSNAATIAGYANAVSSLAAQAATALQAVAASAPATIAPSAPTSILTSAATALQNATAGTASPFHPAAS
jgi:stage V sporulation protein SpoVS